MILLLLRVTCVSALSMNDLQDIPSEAPGIGGKHAKGHRGSYSAAATAEGMST